MKIISRFKDYYDHAVHASMIDESVKYIRRTHLQQWSFPNNIEFLRTIQGINEDFYALYRSSGGIELEEKYQYRLGAICVGPKTYPIWIETHHVDRDDLDNLAYPTKYDGGKPTLWGAPTLEELKRKLHDVYGGQGKIETEEEAERRKYPNSYRIKPDHLTRKLAKRQHAYEEISKYDATALCLHHQTPVLMLVPPDTHKAHYGLRDGQPWHMKEWHVLMNPPLSAFNMQSQIDAFQAWQEVSMFIGGVIPGRQSPMVEITNESKIEKAGFDPKYSFRRRPEGDR